MEIFYSLTAGQAAQVCLVEDGRPTPEEPFLGTMTAHHPDLGFLLSESKLSGVLG